MSHIRTICQALLDACDAVVELVGDEVGEADIMPSTSSWRQIPYENLVRGEVQCGWAGIRCLVCFKVIFLHPWLWYRKNLITL